MQIRVCVKTDDLYLQLLLSGKPFPHIKVKG